MPDEQKIDTNLSQPPVEEINQATDGLKKETQTLNFFHTLLSSSQQSLEQFPSTGKNFFSFPETPEAMRDQFQNLRKEEIDELISFWVSSDCQNQFKDAYGPRAVCFLFRNLIGLKKNEVLGAINKKMDEMGEENDEQKFFNQMKNLYEVVGSSLPESDIENELSTPENINKKLNANQLLEKKIAVESTLNLFKSGVKTEEFDEIFQNGVLYHFVDGEFLPALLGLLEKVRLNVEPDKQEEAERLILSAQARSGLELDDEILTSLLQQKQIKTRSLLCSLYSSVSIDQTPPKVRSILERELLLIPRTVVEMVNQTIVEGKSIDENSFLWQQVIKNEFQGDNLAEIISAAIDINGSWEQTQPLLKSFVEAKFSSCRLSNDGLRWFISSFVGRRTEFPEFLNKYFSEKDNQKVLGEFAFHFHDSAIPNIHGETRSYLTTPTHTFLSLGFEALPLVIRKIFQEDPVLIRECANKAGTKLLDAMFDTKTFFRYYFYKSLEKTGKKGSLQDFDGHYYDLVHEDVWKILSLSAVDVFETFFTEHDFRAGVDLIFLDDTESFSSCLKPFISFLPPGIITHLREEIFPNNQITSHSTKYLGALGFVINDEAISHFSPADQNYLKFYQRFPNTAVRLFEQKDTLFGENSDEQKIITPDLIRQTIDKEDYSEAESLIAHYLLYIDSDSTENIDRELITYSIRKRCFPSEGAKKYLSLFPNEAKLFSSLQEESRKKEWADAISDPYQFWIHNANLFVYLVEAGFSIPDFRSFRSIVNNPAMTEIICDPTKCIDAHDLIKIRERIGVNINNLNYLDYQTMANLSYVLNTPEKTDFYHSLLARNPRSFRNAVFSIFENPEFDITNPEIQEKIRLAIDEIGNISPMVLKEYIGEPDPVRRVEFVKRIKLIRQRFLQNQPVKTILEEMGYSSNVLAELITLSFPGTSLGEVEMYLKGVVDRCEDLSSFIIREDGYTAVSTAEIKIASLREGEKLDESFVKDLQTLFPRHLDTQTRQTLSKQFGESLKLVLTRKGAFTFEEFKTNLPSILSILYDREDVQAFRKTNFDFSQSENVSVFLGRANELLGVYFKDNFEVRLQEMLSSDRELHSQLSKMLRAKDFEQIRKNLSSLKSDEEKAKLHRLSSSINRSLDEGKIISIEDMAGLISLMIESRVLTGENGLRSRIKREQKKFGYKKTGKDTRIQDALGFKGYVSKNAASFFAKMTAGICTAGDVALFNRPDHFHINLVQGDTVIGNIQGYVFEYQGRRALLFRGFNPSSSFVNQSNAEFVCDGMVSIVKQFAADNGVTDVFIPEQTGWHALTNRAGEGVLDYFKNRYIKPDNEIEFPFAVTDKVTVSKLYKI